MSLLEDMTMLVKELEKEGQHWKSSVVKECYKVMLQQAEIITELREAIK